MGIYALLAAYAAIIAIIVKPVVQEYVRGRSARSPHCEMRSLPFDDPENDSALSTVPAVLRAQNVVELETHRAQVMFDRGDEVELADGRRGWVMGPRFRDGRLHYYAVRLQAGAGNAAVPPGKMCCIKRADFHQMAG